MRAAIGRDWEVPRVFQQQSWHGDMPKTLVIGPWTWADSG